MAEEKQTFCGNCGEPCGNAPLCGDCKAEKAAAKAAAAAAKEEEDV